MATKMALANLDLVDDDAPDAQNVAVLQAPGKITVAKAKIPHAQAGEIRVRVHWVGICGSDVEAYTGARSAEFLSTPARLGHEVAGVIDQIGPGVQGLAVGQQVACRYVWGAFANYITCKPFNVRVLPGHLPLDSLSLIEVLPGVLHTAELGKVGADKNVLIMGQGVSGLMLTQIMHMFSPKVLAVTDLHEKNLAFAKTFGATHTYKMANPEQPTMDVVRQDFPEGFDVVVPCLRDGDGMVDAIDAAAFCGHIVMYGCIGPCHKPIDFFKVHKKRLTITSTEPRRDIDMRRLLAESAGLVTSGLIDPTSIVTHRFLLNNIDEAFALRAAGDGKAIHILIDCR